MKTSKQLLAKAGILPKLRLGQKLPAGGVKSTGAHKVKILEDKIIKRADPETGQDTEWVRYTVEENGEQKVYDTRLKDKKTQELSYLVQRFAEVNEGDEVMLEMKKQGIKNYIEVSPLGHSSKVEVEEYSDEDEDPIPEEAEIAK